MPFTFRLIFRRSLFRVSAALPFPIERSIAAVPHDCLATVDVWHYHRTLMRFPSMVFRASSCELGGSLSSLVTLLCSFIILEFSSIFGLRTGFSPGGICSRQLNRQFLIATLTRLPTLIYPKTFSITKPKTPSGLKSESIKYRIKN